METGVKDQPDGLEQVQSQPTEDQRATLTQQWLNTASAAPANQKLWEVYTDTKGDQYYFNTVTQETTWKPPSAVDEQKTARDFNAETDVPASWAKWQDHYITAIPENMKPPRDWCAPYLCKNGRPCRKGTCICGLLLEGDMCERPSKLAIELRFKEVQGGNSVSFAEIQRRKAVEAEKKAVADDLKARTKRTDHMPIHAEVDVSSGMSQSVLGPNGLVAKENVEGPENTIQFMPDTLGPADRAAAFYGNPGQVEELNVQPASLKSGAVTNHEAYVQAAATRRVFSKSDAMPHVQKRMANLYTPAPRTETNPVYSYIKALETPSPPANEPTTYMISSIE